MLKLINRNIIDIDENDFSGKVVITVDTLQKTNTKSNYTPNHNFYSDIEEKYKPSICYKTSLVAHFMDDEQYVIYSETSNNIADLCASIANCQMLCI
jgi:hypothetical protein